MNLLFIMHTVFGSTRRSADAGTAAAEDAAEAAGGATSVAGETAGGATSAEGSGATGSAQEAATREQRAARRVEVLTTH
jgi:hypothetical protein